MSTVTKPRQQRGGRRPSQPHTGPNPSPLVIPGPQSQPQSQSHASTPTSSAQSARAPHSRTSSKSANVIDLTSPTLPTPIRSRGRSGSISKSVAASPSVLRSAAQEAFPPAMPSKGQLVVTNSRKKARYSFPFPTTAQQQQNSQAPFLVSFNNSVPVELKMLPQPAHKKPKRSTRQKVAPQPTTQAASKDNKLKSYMIEPPLGCHSYPFRDNSGKELKDPKFPDFFPWKGTHPEDHVTESAARTGFSDKMHSGEQSSAKVLLAPLIKKNVGVDIISSIFVTILEKRQHIGRISTPSTFKFPPRVTFPGAKKESWLRDLANPDIPLRRLSRTIPLGLRGKELLDECTAKNIPLLRALWYVRCVGANELRSLKRKGAGSLAVGNETKWLREWTQGVVQYLEKGMADCGKDGQSRPSGKAEASSSSSASVARSTWKLRMTYILRLTSQLYSENLLDRGAFLEWYITLLETCSLDKLPLAMLILHIEWDHIVSSRKFSRRLVDALLGKVNQIISIGELDIYKPLLQRLAIHITRLLLNHRQAFINPKSWLINEAPLRACVDTSNPVIISSINNIASRNRNLEPGNTKSSNGSTSPRKAAIDFLDRIRAPYDIEDVTTMFLALSKDYHQTVKALCEWAVTSLRVGLHRLYFAVRLLRKVSRLGIQIQPPIHDFLLATGGGRRCKKHVYLLISELVRSKHFTAGKYMSWLISRGALMRHGSIDEEQPCYIRLLAEIPVNHQHTPSAQRNLRSNLLLQKGFFVNAEAASLAKAKEIVMDRIPGIFVTGNGKLPMVVKSESAFTFEEIKFLHGLTRNVMSELGFWVCAAVRKRQAQSTAPDNRGVNSLGWRPSVSELPSTISPGEFLLVRKVLEELEDFGVLAEVIKLVSNSENPEILSAAADTLSSNVDVYFAIGIVGDILKALFDRYKALQVKRTMEHRPVEHYLTTSLFNFAQYQGCDGDIRQSLESDLLLGKTQAMLPHSLGDTLAEFGEGELDEGVEGLLSGTIPVQPAAVTKAFKVLVERVENGFRGTDMAVYKRFPRLLASLRQLDSATFDPLMENWMIDTIKNTSRPNLAVAFSNMLVAGCFELKSVIRITSEIVGQAGEDSGSIEAADVTELAFQTLALLLDDEDAKLDLTEQEMYSLRLERKRFRATNGKLFVGIFRKAIKLCVAAADPNLDSRLEYSMNNDIVLDLLRNLAFSDFDILVSELVEPLAPQSNPLISKHLSLLIDHLLDEHDSSDISEVDADVQVTRLLQHVNDFSVRLCQLKMRLIFEAEISHASDTTESANLRNAVTKAFVSSITEMDSDRGAIWADLVSVLDDTCVSQIRVYTEEMILNAPGFPNASGSFIAVDEGSTDEEGIKRAGEMLARSLISAVDVTAGRNTGGGDMGTWLPPILADKMNVVLQALSGAGGEVTIQSDGVVTGGKETVGKVYKRLRSWVILFLRIVALHKAEFGSPKTSVVEQGRMVIGLCALLENRCVQNDDFMSEFALDVACAITDDMNEESRQHIRRFLKRRYDLPQIGYMLGGIEALSMGPTGGVAGNVGATSEWLKGMSRGRLVEYSLKPWEQVSDPTPVAGDNDTSLSMTLFHARKVGCVCSG
ncbi:RNA polymerase II mediator complex subunit [Orbilia oligospora]|uniref:Mediator of RNA polymerase II transcription subunit 12 n=1 Tax=Orbilia oligospora TaxID=2813651 RepID=A0A7C8KBM7_ORBOL|nr:RNA polymerase II mediator complex subunit [Orbilia oligospora]KAF3295856.1 RNA polymerase II mediator complex subunit [Orbilia oligospora]TGJ68264.1 RNA polymerase II mediator complex subunit [Orbilia oligospora]